jgi:pyruvate kinase
MRNTKIVATLGPSSGSRETIQAMIEAGADVFRLNLSHGTQQDHAGRIATVRALAREMGVAPAMLLDLQGPKIRLGEIAGGRCRLETGAKFTITTTPCEGGPECASTIYPDFARDVKPGDRVLINDGAVELVVLSTTATEARCRVVSGGEIGSRKGINLPGAAVSSPSLTDKDLDDLRFGIRAGVDLVALSFVRRREDMARLRGFLRELGAETPVIAKIEKPEGWDNFDEILEESDGVMVARGDLGVEIALEKVPAIQKSVIERSRRRGRFVITATQMLESMIENALPTRAEVSDVANAIYDGTDAVMLSAETSAGRYPVEAVRMMARIAREAEASAGARLSGDLPEGTERGEPEIIADAAWQAARAIGARAIVVFTTSGATARLVARYRPAVPIYAFTPAEAVLRRLAPIYGVRAVQAAPLSSTDEMVNVLDAVLMERGCVAPGDAVVLLAGQPIGRPGSTNMMKLHRVGERR